MTTLYEELKQVQAGLRRESNGTLHTATQFVRYFRVYFARYLGCDECRVVNDLPYKAPYESDVLPGVHTIIPIGLDFMMRRNRLLLALQRTAEGHLRYRLGRDETPNVLRLDENGVPHADDMNELCAAIAAFLRRRLEGAGRGTALDASD